MTDDKREGDDLFEDLDKFFAPIQDVDWDDETPRRRDGPARSTWRSPVGARPVEIAEEPAGDRARLVADRRRGRRRRRLVRHQRAGADRRARWARRSRTRRRGVLDGRRSRSRRRTVDADSSDDRAGSATSTRPRTPVMAETMRRRPETPKPAAEHFSGRPCSTTGSDDEPREVGGRAFRGPRPDGGDLFADIHGGDVEDDILSDLDEDAARRGP